MSEDIKKIEVNRETAIDEFDRWAKRWRVGRKMKHANEKDKAEFEEKRLQVIDLIEEGLLMYEEAEDCLVWMFLYPEKARNLKSIKIYRPEGSGLTSGDTYDEKQLMHKTYAYLANMTGKEVAFFKGLDHLDVEPLTTVMNVFLGS
jgi:uncharacterized Fe-S cluster-containing protein